MLGVQLSELTQLLLFLYYLTLPSCGERPLILLVERCASHRQITRPMPRVF